MNKSSEDLSLQSIIIMQEKLRAARYRIESNRPDLKDVIAGGVTATEVDGKPSYHGQARVVKNGLEFVCTGHAAVLGKSGFIDYKIVKS